MQIRIITHLYSNYNLPTFKTIYKQCGLEIKAFEKEAESQEYSACRFKINGLQVISRQAKITPTKTGQFVTCWQRNKDGITEPFNEATGLDFLLINVIKANQIGQFIFPKNILIEKGILSTSKKGGKRGFRVYPPWDETSNKQAQKSQDWQSDFFVALSPNVAGERLLAMFDKLTL